MEKLNSTETKPLKRFKMSEEKYQELKEKRNKAKEDKEGNILQHRSLIDSIKSKGFESFKDFKILKTLEKFEFNTEKTIEFLKSKNEHKESKQIKCQNLKEQLYKEMFPEDKDFDWEKFAAKKNELRQERREKREKKVSKKSDEEVGSEEKREKFDWRKFKKPRNQDKSTDKKSFKDVKEKKEKVYKGKKDRTKTYESKEDKSERVKEIVSLLRSKKIEHIYLDGNNMLFVDNCIRKDCLERKLENAELKLAQVSFEYAKKLGINYTTLVYDNTKQVYSKESSEGVFLRVSSAYPEFESSDDAFKVWAGGLNAERLSKTVFVTSDRELTDRLKEKKVSLVLRSGEFMSEAKEVLGEELYGKCLGKN